MRELKFRVWNGYRMLDDEYLREVTRDSILKCDPTLDYLDDAILLPTYDELKVMQYIGLKDKNEKEIYEGDIVKFNSEKKGTIVFRKGVFTIEMNEDKHILIVMDDIEIIGNIYENPELLNNSIDK